MTVGTAARPDIWSAGATEELAVGRARPPILPVPAAEMVRLQAVELERLRREHVAWRAEVTDRVRFRRTAARAAALEALSTCCYVHAVLKAPSPPQPRHPAGPRPPTFGGKGGSTMPGSSAVAKEPARTMTPLLAPAIAPRSVTNDDYLRSALTRYNAVGDHVNDRRQTAAANGVAPEEGKGGANSSGTCL